MTDKHSQSFFGQATGLTISSPSRKEPFIFFKCIKKKPDGNWEKPSKREGLTIKCNLDEIVMIHQVLKKQTNEWSSYHSYKDKQTQISFAWENGSDNKLWINIGNYSKILSLAQVVILRMLIKHLLQEKIEHATIANINETEKLSEPSSNKTYMTEEYQEPQIEKQYPKQQNFNNDDADKNGVSKVNGSIKSITGKAVLINLPSGKELWFPKSTIHSEFSDAQEVNQSFLIDDWILKKNKII